MKHYLTEVGEAKVITPDCDRTDCVVQATGPTMTTCMGWTPSFDKWGNPLNSDPNSSSTPMMCVTCGKQWVSNK